MTLYLFGATIADLIVICTFIISIFAAFKKGFTILVFNLICLIITLVAVLLLCKPVTNAVYENTGIDEFFSKHIENSIGNFLEEQIDKTGHINTSKTNIATPIAEKINTYIDEATSNSINDISKYVADQLAYIVISAIVVIVLCIVIRLATFLLRAFLYFITELPFIHSIDKVGGIGYGVLRAYIIVYLILAILSLLSPLMANTGIIACINHSKICSNFYNHNVLLNILLNK